MSLDGLDRYLAMIKQANELGESPPIPVDERTALVYEITSSLTTGNHRQAQTLCNQLPVIWQKKVRSFFSTELLVQQQREWNHHGITKTFRFWTENEKRAYLVFCSRVLDVLRRRYSACLGYGAVLSIFRDGDFVPHDDDFDIIVAIPVDNVSTYNYHLSNLRHYLAEAGFIVAGDYVSHFHVIDKGSVIDVFLGLQTGNHVSWHPGPREILMMNDIFPSRVIDFYDVECPIPRNTERYLEVVYGRNWRVPIADWHREFEPKDYADWFWPDAKGMARWFSSIKNALKHMLTR